MRPTPSRIALAGALAASIAATTLVACQLIVGVKDDPGAPLLPARPPPVDGGPTPGDPCAHARPPPKPTVNDGNDANELVFAARKVAVGQRVDGGGPIGFDLDGVCSCENAPRDAAAPRTLCKLPPGVNLCPPDKPLDDPFGRDLGGVNAFQPLALLNVDKSASIDGQLEQGQRGLLVTVTGYNGKANDTSVGVSFQLSPGTTKRGTCGDASAPLPDAGDGLQRYQPCWDGNDEWSQASSSQAGRTLDGYVTNYELVVEDKIGTTKVFAGIGTIEIEMAGPVFQATLVPPAGGKPWLLDGVLAGRIDANATLKTVGALLDPLGKVQYLCEQTVGVYPIARDAVCGARDISFRGADPDATCDGISVAVGFVLEGAKKGATVTPMPPPVFECDAGQALRCP
ncbi:MAG: hypothetical protein IPF92_23045 [Myxococcales bacterium]|nr:hypothetical protein [Myxococcales bacterium]MBL0194718.1 hypothetical protein [Myxococcales bacterium]HQY62214.1 hypothetical protein [Polyangiaceae bacterium]